MTDGQKQGVILIIDDDPDTIQLLSSLLNSQAEILFATDGEAGIQLARKYGPDLILLDQQMPGQSGYETCQLLKSDPDTCDCTIIFVTAQNDAGDEVKAFELGARDFISKPFNPVVVNARVRNQLTLKRQADALRQMADFDGLTSVYNRRYFDRQLDVEIRRHHRQGLALGLAMVDVDHFKDFNDHYGHLAGDACLRKVSTAIVDSLRRPGEFVARYGGEEFAVVLPHTDGTKLDNIGRWLCQTIYGLDLRHDASSTADVVTISVGLVAGVPKGGDAQGFVQAGDEALFQAKQDGRNGYRVATIAPDDYQ